MAVRSASPPDAPPFVTVANGWREYRPEILLAVFVACCLLGMYLWLGWEALPFHFAYVSVTILYGIRLWRIRSAMLAIGLVGGSTLLLTVAGVLRGSEAAPELIEVPLMSLMFIAMVWHVEVRRRAERTVADSAERERRFVANVTHDLMTPLAIARGYAEVLGVDGPPDDDELAETRSVIVEELSRVEGLLSDLILVGNMQRDAALRMRPIEVAPLIERLVRRWAGLGDRIWTVDVSDAGTVAADEEALQRALDNLFENARTHTQDGDEIRVNALVRDGVVQISVEDDGVGIETSAIPHIFDRFYRADNGRGRRPGKSGLGLAIVRDVARGHGGDVEIVSTAGVGTRVTMFLPATSTRERDPDPSPASG
jgi:signal transduction histidine kinase